MGTAHAIVSPAFHEELRAMTDQLPLIIQRATDFGDGTLILFVESTALSEGYHGVQDIILDRATSALRFRTDADI